MQVQDCVFCKIVRGQVPDYRLWQDKEFIAFLDVRPINDGHTLIAPRRHFEYVFDMPEKLYQKMFALAGRLAGPIQELTKAPRLGMIVEGFGVPHVHLHLVPIYRANQLDPHLAHPASPESLAKMRDKLKPALS